MRLNSTRWEMRNKNAGCFVALAAANGNRAVVLVGAAKGDDAFPLMDTTDSVFMTGAYGWAFVNPIRKFWYNLTITAASVVVAIFIGGVEAFGLIGDKLELEGGFWRVVGGLNDNLANFSFAVVGIFIASWIVSAAVYCAKGFDNLQVERL
jgi:nickel/cobalt transporter (NiCoT) family protein